MGYNDVFNEQLISKQNNMTDNLKRGGVFLAGGVLIIAAFMLIPSFAIFIAAAVIAGVIFLQRRFNVEYEYVFTNGELDIDRIFNRNSRKHALSLDVRNFVVMVKVNNPNFKSEVGNINVVKDFSSGVITDATYAAVYEEDGKRIQLLFDPNEQLFDGIKMYIPRKIK